MSEDRLMVSVSGVRGTIGGTLTPKVACEMAMAYAATRGKGGKVVVGGDTRRSGPMIRSAVTAGLLAAGLDVVDLGVVTTPGVAVMVRHLAAAGGVIITASHNPIQYNGIKFLQPSGAGLTAQMAGQVRETWQKRDFHLADVEHVGSLSQDNSTHQRHVDAIRGICDVDKISARKFKVVLDSINGAGCAVSPMLMEALGCQLVHVNAEPNGRFAHQPEPIAANLQSLCEQVRENRADIGFAQDPDADRLVIVDEKGNFIGEEYTLALAAAFVLAKREGDVATNLATSRMIDDVAAATGSKVFRSPTGEANVVEAMEANGCIFAGEGNGGVIDPRVAPIRNSLVGIAMVLEYMAESGETISALAGKIPSYVMLKTKMPCPAGAAEKVVALASDHFASREEARLDKSDGLRVDIPDGWVAVRASNTEPIMRITSEAREEPAARALLEEVQAIADEVLAKT